MRSAILGKSRSPTWQGSTQKSSKIYVCQLPILDGEFQHFRACKILDNHLMIFNHNLCNYRMYPASCISSVISVDLPWRKPPNAPDLIGGSSWNASARRRKRCQRRRTWRRARCPTCCACCTSVQELDPDGLQQQTKKQLPGRLVTSSIIEHM